MHLHQQYTLHRVQFKEYALCLQPLYASFRMSIPLTFLSPPSSKELPIWGWKPPAIHSSLLLSLSLSLSLHLWPSKLTGPINKGMSNRHSNRTGIASTKWNLILHLNEKSRSQEARPTFFFFFFSESAASRWWRLMHWLRVCTCMYILRLSHILLFKILKF